MTRIRQAVIPAAGVGKRFYPLTRAQPKEMLPILDKPLIHYVVEEAIKSKLDQILIIVGHGKDAIIDYFDYHFLDDNQDEYAIKYMPDIFFVRQKKPLGLGDSLRYAKNFTRDEPFVVLLGDTIYRSSKEETVTWSLLNDFQKKGDPLVLVEKIREEKISDYGIVEVTKNLRITKFLEKPLPTETTSRLGITGTYILTAEIYSYLDKLKKGRNDEYQLTDALDLYARDYSTYASILNGKRYDVGTKELWMSTFFEFTKNDERFRRVLKN